LPPIEAAPISLGARDEHAAIAIDRAREIGE
jgi:hypothetical protein